MLAGLRTTNSPRCGQRTEQQHAGVDRAQLCVQKLATALEYFWAKHAEDCIGTKHPAEKQDFGNQEQPDSQLAAVELLFRGVEMVRQPLGTVMVVVAVVVSCGISHQFVTIFE